MRDDAQIMLKQTKQQINALCLRHGKIFDGNSHWTPKHMQWLRAIQFENTIVQEAFSEYMVTLGQLSDKVERLDKRIDEYSRLDDYAEKVNRLVRFKGIKTHTAMSLIC